MTDKQTDRQAGRQAGRQTDRQTVLATKNSASQNNITGSYKSIDQTGYPEPQHTDRQTNI